MIDRIGYGIGAIATGTATLVAANMSSVRPLIETTCEEIAAAALKMATHGKTDKPLIVCIHACELPSYGWAALATVSAATTLFLTYRALCCCGNTKTKMD